MHGKLRFFLKFPLVLIAIALLGWLVMALWNWLMPALFNGVHVIDYAHAIGLLILSRILFGGWRGRRGCHRHSRWPRKENMSEEEREHFEQGLHFARGRHKL
jgi:hypothetical protein